MDKLVWIILTVILLAMLLGQYLAGTSDYFFSIENPRPLDEHVVVMTSIAWGFGSESRRTHTATELAGQGIADVRVFATRRQVLKSILTFGVRREVSIAWRGNAGQHPLGEA